MKEPITTVATITPCFPTYKKKILENKSDEIIRLSSALENKFNKITQESFYYLMKNMNGYYSNLIEGNKTHPLDIEKALEGYVDSDEKKRKLIEENTAHIITQDKIKQMLSEDNSIDVTSPKFLSWIHEELYNNLDKKFRYVEYKGKKIEIIPGKIRKTIEDDVQVGIHIPPQSKRVKGLLEFFNNNYNPEKLNPLDKIIAFAASHHRLVYIHPFIDGNGRVTRLFSYAYAQKIKIDSGGLWSISRGLARTRENYFSYLAFADNPRKGDLDGRGNLTDRGLFEFCNYFLDNSIDQLKFIIKILDLEKFDKRLKKMISNKDIKERQEEQYYKVLREVFIRGEIKRKEVQEIIERSERTARSLIKKLFKDELIKSNNERGPLRLNFRVADSVYLFPDLMPENIEDKIEEEKIIKDKIIKESEFKKEIVTEKFKLYEKKFKDKKTELIANRELIKQLNLEEQEKIINVLDTLSNITDDYILFSKAIEENVKK